MKRLVAVLGMAALLVGFGLALANGDMDIDEPHRHILIVGVEVAFVDEETTLTGFRKCVDLAGGRSLRNNAHHDNMHTGTAGQRLFMNAGHAVIPFASCTALEEMLAGE